MKPSAYSTIILMLITASSACAQAVHAGLGTWPHRRGMDYNGVSRETNWHADWKTNNPVVRWKVAVGTGFSSVAVNGSRVYTLGNTGTPNDPEDTSQEDRILCLDAETGTLIWKHSYLSPLAPEQYEGGPGATPTLAGDSVITLGKQGDLICLNAQTGDPIWQRQLSRELEIPAPRWGFSGSPLVVGDWVVLNAGTEGIAFDKTSGQVVWHNGLAVGGYASPVPYRTGGKDYVAIFNATSIVGLEAKTGRKIWQYPWKTKDGFNIADPIVTAGKEDEIEVFISSYYGMGCARLAIAGDAPQVVWRNRVLSNHLASSILWRDHLVGFDRSRLKCLEYQTGKVIWEQTELGEGSLMMCNDGRMIILTEKGKLVIARSVDNQFTILAESQVLDGRCWTVPVLAANRIYARNATGDLVCVEVSAN